MLIDTDVLIWNLRGYERAAEMLDANPGFHLSAVTYMELVQGMRDKRELRALRLALNQWQAQVIHIGEAISSRASFLVEQYCLGHALQLADALIAATALETGLTLVTGNDKHYRLIDGVELRAFRP
jgi:predicted nucleic acid-binding protein